MERMYGKKQLHKLGFLNIHIILKKKGWGNKTLLTNKNGTSQVALVVNDWPAKAGERRDTGPTSGLGRSPGGEHSNPPQYSCLENPMDRGAWRAIAYPSFQIFGICLPCSLWLLMSLHSFETLFIFSGLITYRSNFCLNKQMVSQWIGLRLHFDTLYAWAFYSL